MDPALQARDSDDRRLVAALTREQKVRLLTGSGPWTLHGEAAIGLRPIVMSDGPAGIRGKVMDLGQRSSSLPCPVALAATWDAELIREVAEALGGEARAKGVDVVLGPAINLVRTPLGGRGFECFSEDPVLSARMAVAYVQGVQQAGVAATAKHFVANDSETDRRSYDARIAEQVLRELYLPPFEACVAEADVALVMAAYNSVNGATMTENAPLMRGLLKDEWGFGGVVVSDWTATRSTEPSALAGLDLVMPGPAGPWGPRLLAAVEDGRVPDAEIDDKVLRLLRLARRVGALSDAGVTVGGAAGPTRAGPVSTALLRRAAARSFVLLRNEPPSGDPPGSPMLPLRAGIRSIAVIGPGAVYPQTQGGGSVRVLAAPSPTPAEALRAALGDSPDVRESAGCRGWEMVPVPPPSNLRDPVTGEPGTRLEAWPEDAGAESGADVIYGGHHPSSVVTWWERLPKAVRQAGVVLVLRARYRAESGGPHVVGAAGPGTIRLEVDGRTVAERTTAAPRESVAAFSRPPEVRAPLDLRPGQEVDVRFEYRPARRGNAGLVSMRLGIAPMPAEADLLAGAVEAARGCDAAVMIVGSVEGTESEGYDRDTLALPGRQDELVRRVAAVNPRTVVLVNSGGAVLMPWAGEVAAIMQIWFGGQAMSEAVADVLLGALEPGGRLPVTLPRAEADCPVLDPRPAGGVLEYSEGLLTGYRGFDGAGRVPAFCFGHGLGYTTWAYETLQADEAVLPGGHDLRLTVALRNTGDRAGREIVQAYLEGPAESGDADPGGAGSGDADPGGADPGGADPGGAGSGDAGSGDGPGPEKAERPVRVLAAFEPVTAEPGAAASARLVIPGRAFARYDGERGAWYWPPGRYTVQVGRSSRDLRLRVGVTVS